MSWESKFIAIEGLDGSGKSTQIGLLIKFFESLGIQTKFVHFPRSQEGIFGELISQFLRGEFGDSNQVHPQLVALLFAEDRKEFSETIRNWQANEYFVLVDRYAISNIAFQCAKLKEKKEKIKLRNWINMFEYDYNNIPKPDLSIYLDVPFSFIEKSLNVTRSGNERNYLNGKEDIHEKDIFLQASVQNEYQELLKVDKSIRQIVCYNENLKMKSVGQIHDEIKKCLGAIREIKNNF